MYFFEVQNVSKRFAGKPVFDRLELGIRKGELITLLGPSGCGKSTLLRCMAGLTAPDSGSLQMEGEDITHVPPQQRGIGMVFQNYALFPNMTVEQNVAFGLKMKVLPNVHIPDEVKNILRLVELEDKAKAYPHELSGGQRQRVALARALVVKPRMLLLDEPLSALDARIRKHLREQIRTIQQTLGLTTVFVTHDQEEALTLSDRIVLMNEGQIVQCGTAEELYTRPVNQFAAQFMGSYNLLNAERAQCLFGITIRGQLALRPEAIRMRPVAEGFSSAEDAAPGHRLSASILTHQLLGNVIRYLVETEQGSLQVDTLNRDARSLLQNGTRVELMVHHHALQEVL
ncbi:MAG: ABC transporter ATP-binding protein [Gammaproteobacteria bacterium]|nr:ABC transporter ATP-binding protein [Gammaproteobacteria bacterium]